MVIARAGLACGGGGGAGWGLALGSARCGSAAASVAAGNKEPGALQAMGSGGARGLPGLRAAR
ncbi:hypothetical protein KIL84_018843 [Mauremys mutica]|uniref:Uncharacterized protein n=1 Tax=Mauremys mutica TaxID=74926 RepID=A0A9D3XSQ8_9SAUR|nr:hypothetical protein KIL84_018843 [Mauremys mutica]